MFKLQIIVYYLLFCGCNKTTRSKETWGEFILSWSCRGLEPRMAEKLDSKQQVWRLEQEAESSQLESWAHNRECELVGGRAFYSQNSPPVTYFLYQGDIT